MKRIIDTLLVAVASAAGLTSALAQGNAFTYQGQLSSGGSTASGLYDLTFTLYNTSTGGTPVSGPLTNSATTVSNGLFTVTLDFGSVFNGDPLWLGIGVRSNGSTGSFTQLTPLQALTSVPYADYATTAGVANTVAGAAVSAPQLNTVGGVPTNGEVLSYNAGNLAWINSASSSSGWSLTGNGGTTPGTDFLGTTDNQPLQLRGNGINALNLQGNPNNNNSVNISGGYWAAVGQGVFGITDFGGGFGGANSVYANFDTIGGGFDNTINTGATYGTIPGGSGNVVSGSYGFAAGQQAQALHAGAFVWSDGSGGAFASTANDQFSVHASGGVRFVTGGAGMSIDGVPVSTGGGGGGSSSGWSLTGNSGTVPGTDFLGTTDDSALELHVNGVRGWQLQPTSDSPNVIGGAPGNYVAEGIVGATIGGGGTITLYGAAYSNSVAAYHGTIGGGLGNSIQAASYESTIGGGNQNTIEGGAFRSSIGGGYLNVIQSNAYESVIGGGSANIVGGAGATVPGGLNNSANGTGSFAAGANAHTTYADSFIWGDGTQAANATGADRFEVLATGGVNFYTDGGVTSIVNGNLGVNTSTPSQALEVNGEFMMVDGLGGLECYLGDDGYGNDIQIGSLLSGVTQVSCYNEADSSYMQLNVGSITILGGSDLAEPFKISAAAKEIPQGSVLVIDDQAPGQLKVSDQPYDTRVAGVLSGANGIHPGIQMQQQGLLEGGRNVALTGRVYVHADASYAAIRPGDLLTTSATPGCAMKVIDHARAQGAILGKAMSGLSEGKGMVLVLVTLQ